MMTIGWAANLMLAMCAIPQMLHAIKHRTGDGLSWWFLNLWFFGEIGSWTYALVLERDLAWPLLMNYTINIVCIGVILLIKLTEERH